MTERDKMSDAPLLVNRLERLRRRHRYVEDSWYSSPKAEDGCCDDGAGDECNCGADEHNELLDALIRDVKEGRIAVIETSHLRPASSEGRDTEDG